MSTPLNWAIIENLIQTNQGDDAFYIADSQQLDFLYKRWVDLLPRVTPFYAVKCNSDLDLIKNLAKYPQMGFDCASISEFSMVLDQSVAPSLIIYSNTTRQHSHLEFASSKNIKRVTFDSECELIKIKKFIPDAELVIRITVQEMGSTYSFRGKYGVDLTDAQKLLKIAKDMEMKIVGVCFHVGSLAKNPKAYYHAIKDCKKVFNYAKDVLDLELNLLNLGGGFSSCFEGSAAELGLPIEIVAKTINEALEKFFPVNFFSEEKLFIIAEPGRYFSQRPYTLAIKIFNKKKYLGKNQVMSVDSDLQPDKFMYYVNQGIYSGFNCILYDHKAPFPRAIYTKGKFFEYSDSMENTHNSVIWGPTCDGSDCVFQDIKLPELDIGDWLLFDNFGAYTLSITSTFNGFLPISVHWIN